MTIKEYQKMVAAYLRQREAEMRRGRVDRLEELDKLSDDDLLKKWAWMSFIAGGALVYFGIPLLLNMIGGFLPELLMVFLWSLVKVCMVLVAAMFAVAIWLTVRKGPNET